MYPYLQVSVQFYSHIVIVLNGDSSIVVIFMEFVLLCMKIVLTGLFYVCMCDIQYIDVGPGPGVFLTILR